MSLPAIEREVCAFLKRKDADALAIKGRWGTGKTYFWRRVLAAEAQKNTVARQRYAYVSLFGLNSLDQLKARIFEETIPTEASAEGVNLHTLRSNLEGLHTSWGDSKATTRPGKRLVDRWRIRGRKLSGLAGQLPVVRDYAPIFSAAAFLMVKDLLLCIDDFERKGTGLQARDILGLLSFLKEQRNCKVVLLFNHGSLDDETEREYAQLREKVIDVELEFAPTPHETLVYVLPAEDPRYPRVLKCVAALGIGNIRIQQRIVQLLNRISLLLAGLEEPVIDNLIASVVLLCYSFYSKDGEAPPFEYLKSLGHKYYDPGAGPGEKGVIEEQRTWDTKLAHYEHWSTDALDLALASWIEKGHPDEEALRKLLSDHNNSAVALKAREEMTGAWRTLRDSLEDNEQEVVPQLQDRFRKNIQYLGAADLDAIVRLLRNLSREQEAEKLIDLFVTVNANDPEVFDLDRLAYPELVTDRTIRDRFTALSSSGDTPTQLREVVLRIAEGHARRPADTAFLAECDENDYYALFKEVRGEQLRDCIQELLRFGVAGNATGPDQAISAKARSALTRIAGESPLNAFRLRKYALPVTQVARSD